MEATMTIFGLTKELPQEERYSLADQMRRSSRSVAANISEAWMKRQYKAAFLLKLNDAMSEAAETQTWFEVTRRCGYWTPEVTAELDALYDRIIGQLITVFRHPEDWVKPA
jgi:four helix bundle protein